MNTSAIDNLIASRPRVFDWLGFQRFWLWIFLILGIIFLFNTGYIIACGLVKSYFIDEASKELAIQLNTDQQHVKAVLVKYFDPIKYKAILYSFFLSLCFFILARYCQKIINRNKYILLLEQECNKPNSVA